MSFQRVQWDAHDFMRFSFNENYNLNIPAPQPFSAVCSAILIMTLAQLHKGGP